MDHVHKSTAGKSRLTKAQAEFRAELVKDAIAKRAERQAAEASEQHASKFVPCPTCHGSGWVETDIDNDRIGHGYPCRRCENGWVEVRQ